MAAELNSELTPGRLTIRVGTIEIDGSVPDGPGRLGKSLLLGRDCRIRIDGREINRKRIQKLSFELTAKGLVRVAITMEVGSESLFLDAPAGAAA